MIDRELGTHSIDRAALFTGSVCVCVCIIVILKLIVKLNYYQSVDI